MKSIQQQCAEKIYSLLPELKEVKEGCILEKDFYQGNRLSGFKVYDTKQYVVVTESLRDDGDRLTTIPNEYLCFYKMKLTEYTKSITSTEYDELNMKLEKICVGVYENSEVKVIGSPIGIAEVLRAIDTRYGTIDCQTNGSSLNFYTGTDNFSKASWNLSTNNILDQSDEVCEFINNLIK